MKIRYAKRFLRDLRKLSEGGQAHVLRAIDLLRKNPFDRLLRNHKLHGELEGMRSISAGFDLRVLYREEGGHAVIFLLQVGTHERVY